MNDPISWEQSLVKKYSSSNHYKLLNQLRNEVKKYPLNNKKKISSMINKNSNQDNKNRSNISITQDCSSTNNPNQGYEDNINKSTVSFNNSKNFSIYKQATNNNRQNESVSNDQLKQNEDSSSSSFKERLNQIDMK